MTDAVRAVPIATGLESEVYGLALNDLRLVLKKRRPRSKQQYDFEAFAYERLAAAGALVPQVLYADSDTLLMTRLAGQEMDDRPELFGDPTLFAAIAADLARCHQIELPGFGRATQSNGTFVGTGRGWQQYLADCSKTFAGLQPLGRLSAVDIRALHDFWEAALPGISLKQGSLVHGDFAMSAIFVEGSTYAGLIDFGDALIGDPVMDLAYFRFKEITKPYGPATYDLLCRAYQHATGRSIAEQRVLFYMIYWGLERLAHCPDAALHTKFGDKFHEVAELIRGAIQ